VTLASPGASFASFADLTSSLQRLPASLQSYLVASFEYIHAALAVSAAQVAKATGLSPGVLFATVAAVTLVGAVPVALSKFTPAEQKKTKKAKRKNKRGGKKKMPAPRYGWSTGRDSREALSPFNSQRDGVPSVTDQDFEYITSEDLQRQGVDSQHAYDYDPRGSSRQLGRPGATSSPTLEIPDDDVLIIRHERSDFREYFPAYSIGDGKLLVGDLKDRVGLCMKLDDAATERVKLYYKGKQLKDDNEPICKYGVKNNSEVMAVLPREGSPARRRSLDRRSESSEEIVVVEKDDDANRRRPKKTPSVRKRQDKDPRGSISAGLNVPREDNRKDSTSRGQSPAGSGVSMGSGASANAPQTPMDKLNAISTHFKTALLPLCMQFTANPPADPKKRVDEHRKISETVMGQVILKLDAVETDGQEAARARRRELVKEVQEVLKGLDARLNT
jgi:hypothetical protein